MAQSLTKEEQAGLLRRYAPVLRFSAGEKFFPMKVEDYLSICPRLHSGKEQIKEWEKLPDGAERGQFLNQELCQEKQDLYLHLLPRELKGDRLPTWVLTVFVAILTVLIVVGICQLVEIIPGLTLGVWDRIKIGALAILIIIWPSVGADTKVHAALILNLLGIFFFGTPYSIGISFLGLAIVGGFVVVYLVFRRLYGKIRASLLHGLCFLPILLAGGLAGAALDLLDPGTPGYWLITAAATGVFYALLLGSPRVLTRATKEIKSILLLGVVALLALCLHFFGAGLPGVDATYKWIAVISLCGVALLWYALDPFPVTKPGPLLHTNIREEIFDWNGRSIAYITVALLLFLALNFLIVYIRPAQIMDLPGGDFGRWLSALGNNLWAIFTDMIHSARSFLHFIVAILIFALSIGILGTRVVSYMLDSFSRNYDTDAAKAKKKYDRLFVKEPGLADLLRPVAEQIAASTVASNLIEPARQMARNFLSMTSVKDSDQEEKPRYWYYGRVCQEGGWFVLQYNFFYAYNDWRSTAGGMNNHEGDWECVSIFLDAGNGTLPAKPVQPFGMAYSQHHHGEFRYWEDVRKVADRGADPAVQEFHPLVYVALGSHANYPEPVISPPSIQFSGQTRKLVALVEGFIRCFRTNTLKMERGKQALQATMQAEAATQAEAARAAPEPAASAESKIVNALRPEKKQLAVEEDARERFLSRIVTGADLATGSLEFAAGDGMRIGPAGETADLEREFCFAPNLPDEIAHRESQLDGKPVPRDNPLGWDWGLDHWPEWNFEVIDDDTPWVGYSGLWGRLVNVEGENGPRGPKWDQDPRHLPSGTHPDQAVRIRWGGRRRDYYLEWLDVLLLEISQSSDEPTLLRKMALQYLARDRSNATG